MYSNAILALVLVAVAGQAVAYPTFGPNARRAYDIYTSTLTPSTVTAPSPSPSSTSSGTGGGLDRTALPNTVQQLVGGPDGQSSQTAQASTGDAAKDLRRQQIMASIRHKSSQRTAAKEQRRQQIKAAIANRQAKRNEASTAPVDPTDSGAVSLGLVGDVFKFGTKLASGIQSLVDPSSSRKRELIELLARQAAVDPNSEALSLSSILKFGDDIVDGVKTIVDGDSSSSSSRKREFIELLARQTAEDPNSEALSLSSVLKFGDDIVDGVKTIVDGDSSSNQNKREPIVIPPGSDYTPPTLPNGDHIRMLRSLIEREPIVIPQGSTFNPPVLPALPNGDHIRMLRSLLEREPIVIPQGSTFNPPVLPTLPNGFHAQILRSLNDLD